MNADEFLKSAAATYRAAREALRLAQEELSKAQANVDLCTRGERIAHAQLEDAAVGRRWNHDINDFEYFAQ